MIESLQQELESVKHQIEIKNSFFANMSHEIRTPMNAIVGLSQMLLRQELSAIQKDYINKIEKSGLHLLDIINDILDFSKLESDNLVIEQVAFDMQQMLSEIADLISMQAKDKDISITFDIDTLLSPVIVGDPLRLKQIIVNLLTNAIKFTNHGGIVLRAKKIKEVNNSTIIGFSVNDTGLGIKKEMLGKLFDPYVQSEKSTARKFGGTGLGLMITKQLVERMGGEIWVESEYGKGSTFFFTLKCTEEKDGYGNYQLENDIKAIKPLLVDGNSDLSTALKSYFSALGINATISDNPFDAAVLIESGRYDVVIADKHLFETIESALRDKKVSVNAILCDYSADESDLTDSDNFKFLTILQKPFSLKSVHRMLLSAYSDHDEDDCCSETERFEFLNGARIFVAEDNPINQTVIDAMLKDFGVELKFFNDGEKMISFLAVDDNVDLILMDIQMPGMDGYECTSEIRKESKFAQLPIVALTADTTQEGIEQAYKVGMNDYIIKPMRFDDLISVLAKYIEHTEHAAVDDTKIKNFLTEFAASVRRFGILIDFGDFAQMVTLVRRVEAEARRIGIDRLNGYGDKVEVIFDKKDHDLNQFVSSFFDTYKIFSNVAQTILGEDKNKITPAKQEYIYNTLNFHEGISQFEGQEHVYLEKFKHLYYQYRGAHTRLKNMINNSNYTGIVNFNNELRNDASELKLTILLDLCEKLEDIFNVEKKELEEFYAAFGQALGELESGV